DHSGLGRVVVSVERLAHQPVGRSGLQNHAAANFAHVAGCSLRHIKHAGQIDGENLLPLFRTDVEKLVADADTGVVDQHGDSIHQAHSLGECGLDLHEVSDVSDDGFGQAG